MNVIELPLTGAPRAGATELPTAECLAHLDDIFRAMTAPPEMGTTIAKWKDERYGRDGAEIIVDGLFTSRGVWGANGIRWHCPKLGNKGLFGRGLACYGERMPAWAESLPRVK